MSKFNGPKVEVGLTENLAGGQAYQLDEKMEFATILLTSFLKDQFYRSENETIDRIEALMKQIKDKKFLAKSAIYARTEFGMRSVSHLVAAKIISSISGQEWAKNFIDKVVYRPDDMTEIWSCYSKDNKKIANSLKKGIALAFQKFNEYNLAKYRGENKEYSLVDLANYCHPKANDAITKLMKGELKSTETWETKLTQAGQKATNAEEKEELKKEAWESLLKEKKLPYFACLRNLRNIIEQAPDQIDNAIEILTDKERIKKSLVLPFRFLTALKEIAEMNSVNSKEVKKVLIALNTAIDISVDNVPTFDGDTLVVLDTSGSMMGKPSEIGSLFSAILVKKNLADFMVFSNDAKYINLNPANSTLTLAESIHFQAGGTNFHSIFQTANKKYDRIIILSDMQGWIGYDSPKKEYNKYKTKFAASPKLFSFDLSGYGTLQFPEKDVYCLAGFSEKTFDIMKLLEQDKKALINKIEEIQL